MARLTREELLRRLVAFDSSSQVSNRPIADFICEYVDAAGARIIRDEGPDDKVNLLLTRGPEAEDRSGLALSGHMDTVPFAEPGWDSPPLTLTRRGDRYLGRGVCDMKGFLALALDLFTDAAGPRERPLVLLLTRDEELGGLGARHFVEHGPAAVLPRATVIGEPTSLAVVRMHKGHLKLRVTVQGRPGHSAYPDSGRNAIELAGRVIQALTGLGAELAREASPEVGAFGIVPFATLNLARIAGGTALNVIPDHCMLDLGVRLLPGTTGAAMTARVHHVVAGALDRAGYSLELINESPPMCTDASAPIHASLCARVGQTSSRAVAFTTDGGWLRARDLDCVVFGPGSIEAAHKPNEWLEIAEFERAGAVLDATIREWCGGRLG